MIETPSTFAHYCEEYFQVPWRFYQSLQKYNLKKITVTKTYKG